MKPPFKVTPPQRSVRERVASRDVNASPSRFRAHDGRLVQVGFFILSVPLFLTGCTSGWARPVYLCAVLK